MDLSGLNTRIDDLSDPRVIDFLEDHLRHMVAVTPPGCVHALDVDALRKPEITFWTVWEKQSVICCGALKKIDAAHAELKSMRTATTHARKGIASGLLRHILAEARKRGFERVSLETGSYEAFFAARRLYEKYGFKYCEPFSDYPKNATSVFMTIQL